MNLNSVSGIAKVRKKFINFNNYIFNFINKIFKIFKNSIFFRLINFITYNACITKIISENLQIWPSSI